MGKGKKPVISVLPEDFTCLELLNPNFERSTIEQSNLDTLIRNKAFPEVTNFLIPDRAFTSDCVSENWIGFLEYPFTIGLKFPFSPLVNRFFKAIKLAYPQLMPVGWRILQTLHRLALETGLTIGLEELAFTFEIRSHGPHRYNFRAKTAVDSLVIGFEAQDRGWKNKYFYVRKDSLEGSEELILKWRSQVAKLSVLFPEKDDTYANVKKILNLSFDIRKYRPLPVDFETASAEEGDTGERVDSRALPDPSINNMSSAGFSKDDVLLRIKARAEIKEVKLDAGKPPNPKVDCSSSKVGKSKGVGSEAKKRKVDDVEIVKVVNKEDWKADNALAGMEDLNKKSIDLVACLLKELEIKDYRIKIFEQKSKFEGDRANKAEKELKIYANECKERNKEIESLNKLVLEQSERLSTIEIDRMKELNEAKEKFINDAARTMLETKVDMMQDFLDGKHLAWNIEEQRHMLKIYLGEEVDGDEVNSPAVDTVSGQVDEEMQDVGVERSKIEEIGGKNEDSNIAAVGQEKE